MRRPTSARRRLSSGVEQKAHFFAFDLPHSDACYIMAYPAATSEAWVDGHVHAFAFFGRVPVSVLYDNDRCLVASILRTAHANGPNCSAGSCHIIPPSGMPDSRWGFRRSDL